MRSSEANQSQVCLPAANLGVGALGEQAAVQKCCRKEGLPGCQELCINAQELSSFPELTVSGLSCLLPLEPSDSGLCLPFLVCASPLLRQDAGVLGWGE